MVKLFPDLRFVMNVCRPSVHMSPGEWMEYFEKDVFSRVELSDEELRSIVEEIYFSRDWLSALQLSREVPLEVYLAGGPVRVGRLLVALPFRTAVDSFPEETACSRFFGRDDLVQRYAEDISIPYVTGRYPPRDLHRPVLEFFREFYGISRCKKREELGLSQDVLSGLGRLVSWAEKKRSRIKYLLVVSSENSLRPWGAIILVSDSSFRTAVQLSRKFLGEVNVSAFVLRALSSEGSVRVSDLQPYFLLPSSWLFFGRRPPISFTRLGRSGYVFVLGDPVDRSLWVWDHFLSQWLLLGYHSVTYDLWVALSRKGWLVKAGSLSAEGVFGEDALSGGGKLLDSFRDVFVRKRVSWSDLL